MICEQNHQVRQERSTVKKLFKPEKGVCLRFYLGFLVGGGHGIIDNDMMTTAMHMMINKRDTIFNTFPIFLFLRGRGSSGLWREASSPKSRLSPGFASSWL